MLWPRKKAEPALGPLKTVVDGVLEADRQAPRKQSRTGSGRACGRNIPEHSGLPYGGEGRKRQDRSQKPKHVPSHQFPPTHALLLLRATLKLRRR